MMEEIDVRLRKISSLFEIPFDEVQAIAHDMAAQKGQWDEVVSIHDVVAHIHCEVSELFKAINNGDEISRNIPPFRHREEEAADIILLLMSMAEHLDWDLGGAVIEKAKYNLTRRR